MDEPKIDLKKYALDMAKSFVGEDWIIAGTDDTDFIIKTAEAFYFFLTKP